MRFKNAKADLQTTLSWFSDSFSRPSFKIFSCFIIGFIQLELMGTLVQMELIISFILSISSGGGVVDYVESLQCLTTLFYDVRIHFARFTESITM